MTELELTAKLLLECNKPESVFLGNTEDEARPWYHRIQKQIHPDRNPDNPELAHQASAKLNDLWDIAKRKFAKGTWQTDEPVKIQSFETRRYEYHDLEQIHTGQTCGVFSTKIYEKKRDCYVSGIVKIPHSKADNDLLEREIQTLKIFTEALKPFPQMEGANMQLLLPKILETIRHKNGKKMIVFVQPPGYESGWYNLEQITKAHPNGLNSRQICFIGNRIFESLSIAHSQKISHNCVTPHHVIIHAEKHLGQVIDWTNADKPMLYIGNKDFLAPEATKNHICLPSCDIYAAAKCLLSLARGDYFCLELEEPIVEFLHHCIQPKRRFRPFTAMGASITFREVQKQVFGKPQFEPLEMST